MNHCYEHGTRFADGLECPVCQRQRIQDEMFYEQLDEQRALREAVENQARRPIIRISAKDSELPAVLEGVQQRVGELLKSRQPLESEITSLKQRIAELEATWEASKAVDPKHVEKVEGERDEARRDLSRLSFEADRLRAENKTLRDADEARRRKAEDERRAEERAQRDAEREAQKIKDAETRAEAKRRERLESKRQEHIDRFKRSPVLARRECVESRNRSRRECMVCGTEVVAESRWPSCLECRNDSRITIPDPWWARLWPVFVVLGLSAYAVAGTVDLINWARPLETILWVAGSVVAVGATVTYFDRRG